MQSNQQPQKSATPRMGNPLEGRRSQRLWLYMLSGKWIGAIADNAIIISLVLLGFGFCITLIFNAESRSGLAGIGSRVGRFFAPVVQENVDGVIEPLNGGEGVYVTPAKASPSDRTVEIKPGAAKE